MPNKLNKIIHYGIYYSLADYYILICVLICEFEKNADSFYEYAISHNVLVCLATIGVCVFVRWLRLTHFYYINKRKEAEKK